MYGGDGNDDPSCAFLGGYMVTTGDDVPEGSVGSLYGGNGNDTLTAGVYNVMGFGSSTAYGGNRNDVLTGYGSSLLWWQW